VQNLKSFDEIMAGMRVDFGGINIEHLVQNLDKESALKIQTEASWNRISMFNNVGGVRISNMTISNGNIIIM
ncbi:MAG: hypothetical protein ACRCXZ_10240, partial [Patescibacteria group bacterium]